ncbi:MAG: hypothetical protein KatS3mg001_385 [Candidatus Pacearchaeota archaeon]|nr:MAG: hypothetical protein KatS3mg001_385 [Candidatus Pacearchaeota archaeon]
MKANRKWELEIPLHRKEAIEKSRAILSGQISEQIAPYFYDFPYKPTECRFLGKPIDFIVFPGLEEGNPREIVFLEVKTNTSSLSKKQRAIKKLVEDKKVGWKEYKINYD